MCRSMAVLHYRPWPAAVGYCVVCTLARPCVCLWSSSSCPSTANQALIPLRQSDPCWLSCACGGGCSGNDAVGMSCQRGRLCCCVAIFGGVQMLPLTNAARVWDSWQRSKCTCLDACRLLRCLRVQYAVTWHTSCTTSVWTAGRTLVGFGRQQACPVMFHGSTGCGDAAARGCCMVEAKPRTAAVYMLCCTSG